MMYFLFQSGEMSGGADDKKKKKRNEVNTAASVRTFIPYNYVIVMINQGICRNL